MLKKALPHILSIVAFYAIASTFYSPVILDSKRLVQGDTKQYIGMSHEALSYEDIEGERPSWTNSMFGGMPTVQITGTGIMTLPKCIWKLLRLLMSPEIMTLFLAMLSAYVLALCLKAPPLVAFIAGVTFGLGSINTLYLAAGHATKVRAISLMPGVLGGVIYAFRNNMWGGAAITAFFLAMHIDANHLQMTYYLMFMIAAVGICELVAAQHNGYLRQFVTTSVLLIGAALIALLPSLPSLQITKDYSHYTTRGEAILDETSTEHGNGLETDYILEYSLSRGEWLSSIVPDIKGGASQLYWGEQRFSGGAMYFGAIAFTLLLAFFFVVKDRMRWPLLAITLLSIILSWRDASFITDFFLDYVPMFNKFRDTKMMLVLVQLAVAVGVSISLKRVWEDAGSDNWKPWIYAFGGVSGLLISFYILPETFFDFTSSIRADHLREQYSISKLTSLRVEIFRADVFRSIGLIVVAGGGIVAVVKGLVKRDIALGILALVMLYDVYSVDKRYPSEFDTEFNVVFPHEATKAEREIAAYESSILEGFEEKYLEHIGIIEEDLGININERNANAKYLRASDAAKFRALNSLSHFRVLNWINPMNDARTSYFFKSIGGYHGAKLRRYQDFITHVLLQQNMRFSQAVSETGNVEGAMGILKGAAMLNTKYIIGAGERPIPLNNALGPAWVVHNVNWVDTNEDELFAIENTDVSQVALVHEEFKALVPDLMSEDSLSTESSVELVEYHPEGSTYSVSTESDGMLILSEVWYPEGWSATVDGEEVPLVRANYILRALPILAGDHDVVLSYNPPVAQRAGIVGGIGSFLLALFIAFSFYKCFDTCILVKQ
ncbi:MAG: hypothetical protein CL847_01760 [Crocinitomicaceae bacterium]|nr:hypothetical protein [Crocinitomicaceae bacterium]|tara:strand:+ start:3708 stop:6215 length:2508 start_codon:yes stop_codon:yes gene_type:complete